MHDFLTERGLREASEISLVMPLGVPIWPSPAASDAVLAAFVERDITWCAERLVRALDPARNVALLSDGSEMAYDLFLGVPVHRAPAVAVESGLTVDCWIPVDPMTLETSPPGVYAEGDETSVGTPKAGVFAEGQAAVVADAIIGRMRGTSVLAPYDGHVKCCLEFGHDQVARVDVTFRTGDHPTGFMDGPSQELVADKKEFGSSRITTLVRSHRGQREDVSASSS